jgi:hypothetical protein
MLGARAQIVPFWHNDHCAFGTIKYFGVIALTVFNCVPVRCFAGSLFGGRNIIV